MPGKPPTVAIQLRAPSTGHVPKTCATPLGQITGLPRKSDTEVITGTWPNAATAPRSIAVTISREFMAGIIPQRCRHLCDAAIPRNEREAKRSVIGRYPQRLRCK
jgi:hypothetical protein